MTPEQRGIVEEETVNMTFSEIVYNKGLKEGLEKAALRALIDGLVDTPIITRLFGVTQERLQELYTEWKRADSAQSCVDHPDAPDSGPQFRP